MGRGREGWREVEGEGETKEEGGRGSEDHYTL